MTEAIFLTLHSFLYMEWKANIIRQTFFDFFKKKEHRILSSSPMVLKDDPTLMFTNAGMNQFKEIFLGNKKAEYRRVANSQKCLRVSGKHNDLDEVGVDTYHHTMFEMLGNWSFGDYFKKEAIEWAWELLTEVFKIDPDRLYVTVFQGDASDNLKADDEAEAVWKSLIHEEKILHFGKKDNFWEMGTTGPCGPCSEIHIDLRNDGERKKITARELVNTGHPLVIEVWNLVFIEFNRSSNGILLPLPQKHIDTGMGFERLCMVLQNKKSNYDTDVFNGLISTIESNTKLKKGEDEQVDVSMRVVADHVRAVAFAIADGQLPSNAKAGYVIRRILRRAIRFGYSFLNKEEPFIYKLVPVLVEQFGDFFPGLAKQEELISKVIREEEENFLKTLNNGIQRLSEFIETNNNKAANKIIPGELVFELYDTYGFPSDLTQLVSQEKGWQVDMEGFKSCLEAQKQRSKKAQKISGGEWVEVLKDDTEEFVGYDYTETNVNITRYRKIKTKDGDIYHLVFNITPFYAEGGGQKGDTGKIISGSEEIEILNTFLEHQLIVHLAKRLPVDLEATFKAIVNKEKRLLTACNHSATHLLQQSLREVLGKHVEQKGSLVNEAYLRFDFVHYKKLTMEELGEVEKHVNSMVRANLPRDENRHTPYQQAIDMGAIALFGEKYGDVVRVIRFGDSIEFCGGTHVDNTGQIGLFKIISESAVAAGVRRIEAITSSKAQEYIDAKMNELAEVRLLLKNPKDTAKAVSVLMNEVVAMRKKLAHFKSVEIKSLKQDLLQKMRNINDVNFIAEKVELDNASVRTIAFQLKAEVKRLYLVLASEYGGKANISVVISEDLIKEKAITADKIIRELAKEIDGAGGGQAFFATAGGKKPGGISAALKKSESFISD